MVAALLVTEVFQVIMPGLDEDDVSSVLLQTLSGQSRLRMTMTKEQSFWLIVIAIGLVVAGGGFYVLTRGWYRDRAERKVKDTDGE